MDLSVIICSYNRYDLLSQAAHAVASSHSFDDDRMELVVVENTPPRQRRNLDLDTGVRMVVCEEPGLSNARNEGIKASTGNIVAFVDDDAIVSDSWCESVVTAFAALPHASVCGGRTVP